ncbi:50S ribosomal protein L15 [uncultured archaeon]|nr:50S ribosomal protein L15 [uncultured archaeon]
MVKVHKRNKRTRLRGSRSGGYGFRKKHKGHGNKGGFGMSGTGKRGSQIQQKAYMMAIEAGFKSYFGKQGMTSASTQKKRTEQINLKDIKANLFQKDGQKIELKEHKILGDGEGFKAEIHAASASKSAIEKMEKAGGKIVLPVEKSDSTKEVSSEKAEEKTEGKKVAEVKSEKPKATQKQKK